jgi:WhiB family transcriptional regulator, redox-sensing transcriptional regulator
MNPLFASLMRAPGAGEDLPLTIEDYMARPAWHRQAACRGVGVSIFVAGMGGQYEELPRQLCARCPVRRDCLESALADGSLQGFWGGTTPSERKQMRWGRAVA